MLAIHSHTPGHIPNVVARGERVQIVIGMGPERTPIPGQQSSRGCSVRLDCMQVGILTAPSESATSGRRSRTCKTPPNDAHQ